MARRTVHLICNAHIDPVWLWPWSAGLDEVVSTCESVCGLLERNPDVIFTRGEAWVYEQVERIAPKVFARIRKLIQRGQWEIVGGWYIQPDCNLPGERSFVRQIELGREYFRRTFGMWPKTGYNVDSFGHNARLPALMHAAGQRHYVMLRPEQHELALPAQLFWWQGEPRGPRVLTFRIAGGYCTVAGMSEAHVQASLSALPEGVTHTMCFVGLGDHGGGPSQDMIEWCRAHRTAFDGAELVFSSPSRFFRAVQQQARRAPVVTGELQMHAVGCYSVHRAVKTRVRRAENFLARAERALAADAPLRRESAAALEQAWRWLCFSQFHDTLGGTSVASAYEQVDAQLGYSCAVGDEITTVASRRRFASVPGDFAHRIALLHYGGELFDDWIEHEPWLEWTQWQDDWAIEDERGKVIPHQCLKAEGLHGTNPRLLFRMRVKPGQLRLARIVRQASARGGRQRERQSRALTRHGDGDLRLELSRRTHRLPELELVADLSDTWAHGISGFAGPALARPVWTGPVRIDDGPLMTAWMVEGDLERSRLRAEWRVYTDHPYMELRLHVHWSAEHRLLRLVWPQAAPIAHRLDRMPGHALRRGANGDERPLHDWTCLFGAGGKRLGAVVCPDVFSVSATSEELRLTLLRSPVMAHHDPDVTDHPRRVFSDQGAHSFVFRFYPEAPPVGRLEQDARALQMRPVIGDITRGMPQRALRGQFAPVAR